MKAYSSEHGILYVDDEPVALKYFKKELGDEFSILTAAHADEALAILEKDAGRIGLVMTDQKMPGCTGVQLLEKIRHMYPTIIRILVTAYADVDSAVEAVNTGAIFKYIRKPWELPDLRVTLMRALNFFTIQRERDDLLKEKLSTFQQLVTSDRLRNLTLLAACLEPRFRNSLSAVDAYRKMLSSIPAPERFQGVSWDDRGSLANREAEAMLYLITSISETLERPVHCFDAPASLEEVLRPLTVEGEDGCITANFQFSPSLPPLKANRGQLLKVFRTVASIVGGSDEQRTSVALHAQEVQATPGRRMIEVHVVGSEEESLTSSSDVMHGNEPSSKRLGLDFVICYFLVFHHGGDIRILDERHTKISVTLPCDPLDVPSVPHDEHIFKDLLHQKTNWEMFN